MRSLNSVNIGIIGLGYVGLPLAVEFSKHYPTIGYDIDKSRVNDLNNGIDDTLEVNAEDLESANQLIFTSEPDKLATCNVYIVTVPTPVNENNYPDLRPLIKASRVLGSILNKNDTVIYESTVYPGATEEVCVPELTRASGLSFNKDFFVGYSPERINPGDKDHHVTDILKITSGSTADTATFIDNIYKTIIKSGTYKASSIKVAEAAKVIENVQRDVNIALINELSLIFSRLDIDTLNVLEAAGTKWNFLPFRPGLVGGHCIGVDPYYLVHKAHETGFEPKVIPASRYTNEYMAYHVAQKTIKLMSRKKIEIVGSDILVMGLAFKENCPDLRNTKIIDLISELRSYNANIDVYDPWVNPDEAVKSYNIHLLERLRPNWYDAVIIAVAHDQFHELGSQGIKLLCKDNHVIFDVKYVLPESSVDGRL